MAFALKREFSNAKGVGVILASESQLDSPFRRKAKRLITHRLSIRCPNPREAAMTPTDLNDTFAFEARRRHSEAQKAALALWPGRERGLLTHARLVSRLRKRVEASWTLPTPVQRMAATQQSQARISPPQFLARRMQICYPAAIRNKKGTVYRLWNEGSLAIALETVVV